MKRIITGLLITVATLIPTSAAFASSAVNTNFDTTGHWYPTSTSMVVNGTAGNYVMAVNVTKGQASYTGNNATFPFTKASTFATGSLNASIGNTITLMAFVGPLSGPCTTSNVASCRLSSQYRGEVSLVYGTPPPVLGCTDSHALNYNPAADTDDGSCNYRPNLPQIITQSDNHFASSTGFNTAAGVGFVGNTFIMPWLGTLIAAFYSLRFWIAALLAIAAIAYFAYRGFRFLNTR